MTDKLITDLLRSPDYRANLSLAEKRRLLDQTIRAIDDQVFTGAIFSAIERDRIELGINHLVCADVPASDPDAPMHVMFMHNKYCGGNPQKTSVLEHLFVVESGYFDQFEASALAPVLLKEMAKMFVQIAQEITITNEDDAALRAVMHMIGLQSVLDEYPEANFRYWTDTFYTE